MRTSSSYTHVGTFAQYCANNKNSHPVYIYIGNKNISSLLWFLQIIFVWDQQNKNDSNNFSWLRAARIKKNSKLFYPISVWRRRRRRRMKLGSEFTAHENRISNNRKMHHHLLIKKQIYSSRCLTNRLIKKKHKHLNNIIDSR